jgi:GNAT superfamily N-acetyltransferase
MAEVLAFRNANFNEITAEHWAAMGCTAAVAREGAQLVGFIPLQFREQVLRPGITAPVVYENAVGVHEEMRGQGIGTRMIEWAATALADRVDALMVIRGGERSDGYRFYRRSGHADLCYARSFELPVEHVWAGHDAATDREGIQVLDRARWLAAEPALLALYARRYGRYGGGRQRGPGYWQEILDSHVYRDQKWWLIALRGTDRLRGYLVASPGMWDKGQHLYVYEVVGEDDRASAQLIRYARRLSVSGGYRAPYISLANPVGPLLRSMGFLQGDSSPHVMARVLRPERLFRRLAGGSNLLNSLSLTVNTPHRTVAVVDAPDARYAVRMEMKEAYLARLMMCRLDLAAAVEMELVRWDVHDPGVARELCAILAPCDWVQWFTDFV